MDEILQQYRNVFDQAFEVVQTLILVTDAADFRIEILRRWPEGDYKPRLYKQVEIPSNSPASTSTIFFWREYEMGYQAVDDADTALKMAMSVIKNRNGR